jgi:hypothetical protein
MVIRQWGEKWRQPDNAYKMSNGTKFDSTDQYLTGIYSRNVVPNNYRLLLDPYLNAQYGDMDGYGLLLDGVSFDGSPGALDLG